MPSVLLVKFIEAVTADPKVTPVPEIILTKRLQ